MTTGLFMLDVIGFVLIALWAYRMDRKPGANPDEGLFGMRAAKSKADGAGKRTPAWRSAGAAPSRGGKSGASLPTR